MSRLPFELMLALRYLRPKRTFVSVITLISIIGVMLGVAVLIIVISVMSGFGVQLRDKIIGYNGHLKVFKNGGPIDDYESVLSKIRGHPRVKAAAPFVLGKVPVETQPLVAERAEMDVPLLHGVDAELERRVSNLHTNIIAGEFDVRGNGLVIGAEFARNLGLRVGDRVALYSLPNLKKMKDNRGRTNEVAIPPDDFTVKGVFDAEYFEFNALVVFSSLANAQELTGIGDKISGVQVTLADPLEAGEVRAQLMRALGDDYHVVTWLESGPAMMAVLVEKNMMLYILFFIVLVAAFGITCTLITFIMMKTREIGLMKALGASNYQVMWVFLAQSMIVSVAGVLAGTAFGVGAVTYRNGFLRLMRHVTGIPLFPAEVYGFYELPALIMPSDILVICGGSLVICVLAAAFPVWHASKLDPVQALRHE